MEAPLISAGIQKEGTGTKPGRMASIDALRGFDMLMISGGGTFIFLLGGKTGINAIDVVAAQFEHPAWHGFTFYDFIFPLFLFLAGVSLPYSIDSALSKGITPASIRLKIFKRMLILIVLGMLDKNAPIDIFDPMHIRYGSVLGRIGLATFVSAVLYLRLPGSMRIGIIMATLMLYFLALMLIPVPGFGSGDLSFEGNLVGWFDRSFMPGILKQGTYDELAILTQFPAICLTLAGTLAGEVIVGVHQQRESLWKLIVPGIVSIIIALLWNPFFPINKHLWSSSFIALTGGMACLFLALFYWTIDVRGWKRWAFFFQVIGMNSLFIYLAVRFVSFNASSELLFSGIYKYAPEKWHEVFNALGGFVLVWLVMYFLYKKKIFIKV